jgi:hypothetical protein
MRARWGLCALLGALGLTLAPTSAPAALSRDFYGVIPVNELTPAGIDMMGQGKVGTLRLNAFWPSLEPSPDGYEWDYLDLVVGNAARNGIEVLPFPYGTPSWVGVKCDGLTPSQCERVPPVGSEAAREAWKDFLRDLAERYGPGGAFWQANPDIPPLPISQWQPWNEPSSPTYYRPQPSTKGYAELLKISHEAITSVDPNAKLILAGLFGTPRGDLASRNVMWKYLGRLYKIQGIKRTFDAVALHPYSPNLKGIEFQFEKALQKIDRNHDRRTGIWVTEIGWGSDQPSGDKPLIKGPGGQTKLLEKSFDLLRKNRNKWNVEGVVWYAWQDPGFSIEGCSFCSSAGLLEEDGSPKSSWNAFVKFTGGTP